MNIQHNQPDTESLDHKVNLIITGAKAIVDYSNSIPEYKPKYLSRRELQAIIDRHSS